MKAKKPRQKPSWLPNKFRFYIDCFLGDRHELRLADGKLLYFYSSHGPPPGHGKIIDPAESAWNQFWANIEEAKVWEWERSYFEPLLDGSQWELSIKRGMKNFRSFWKQRLPRKRFLQPIPRRPQTTDRHRGNPVI